MAQAKTNQAGVAWFWDDGAITDNIGFLTVAPITWQMFAGSGGSLNFTPRDTVKHIFMCLYDTGGSPKFFIDGGAPKVTGPMGTDPSNGIVFGARTGGSGSFSDINLYDFTNYNKVVPTSELNQLGNYFAAQHNLTWTNIP